MVRQLTDDDVFVLACCLSNRIETCGAIIAPYETRILIEHLDRISTLSPVEKTAIFLARQDLLLGRYHKAATRVCNVLLRRAHERHAL